MRRTTQVLVCLAVAAGGFSLTTAAPAGTGPAGNAAPTATPHTRVEFTVSNPGEGGTARIVVGNRYDPMCKADTVVLLQHGLSYFKEAWDWPGYSAAAALTRAGYAVIAIDRLGYGESKLENGTKVSFEGYADMANQIVGQLRMEFAHVVIGGHSAGAGVSEYAQGMYGSADALLALGWHHRPSDGLLAEFMTGDTVRSTQDDYEYFMATPEHRAEKFYEPDADPAVVAGDTAAANLTPSGEIQSIGKQPSRFMVGNVKVPVFIGLSEKDWLFEPQYAGMHKGEFLSSPSVTVDMVPGAGHTFMLAPQGPAGTDRMVSWLKGRPEAPSCS